MSESDANASANSAPTPCPRCGQRNAATVEFCAHCGQQLFDAPIQCPGCHAYQNPTHRLCDVCGADLRAAGPTGDHVA